VPEFASVGFGSNYNILLFSFSSSKRLIGSEEQVLLSSENVQLFLVCMHICGTNWGVACLSEENVKNLFERVAIVLFERAVSRAAQAMARADGSAPRLGGSKVDLDANGASSSSCC